jgi:hypothetical protein
MHKLCIYNWVGKCKLFLALPILLMCFSTAKANNSNLKLTPRPSSTDPNIEYKNQWREINKNYLKQQSSDYQAGISYIISGSIALAGGLVGGQITADPIERGLYVVFQSIGVASIGYGAYKWKIGDDDRLLTKSLATTEGLTEKNRIQFMQTYQFQKSQYEITERKIKAITHGLIAAINLYNASKQEQDGIKNSLYFIGGVNMLAAISFSF